MLRGKKILIGVCGSIAAYKSALLVRFLIKEGAEVRVLMTDAARQFITPLTLGTLSKNPVLTTFAREETGEWNSHVELGLWADALVIAPASANTIASFAHGICNNLITATYLSARCAIFVAPAMDLDMYRHPATQENLQTLKKWGNTIIDAEHGDLASGLTGVGRMSEPEHIITVLEDYFHGDLPLKGKKVLVTAGPTYEPVDPVRYIGNRSSGKMGYAIAGQMAALGARVTLVSGPSRVAVPRDVQLVPVTSAGEMYREAGQHFEESDIAIFAAAVSDYTPKSTASRKIKKDTGNLHLELIKTTDIAGELGKKKRPGQLMVGFALETNDEQENARDKLVKKKFDLIVLNSLNDQGAGFEHDTNKVTFIDRNNKVTDFELKSKQAVARDIADAVINLMNE